METSTSSKPKMMRKWTHGSRLSPLPSPLTNTTHLPAPRVRQHPVGRRPYPPASSPSPASPVLARGRRIKRKTKRRGSAFSARRSELPCCPALLLPLVRVQHASSDQHITLCLMFLHVVDFFSFFFIFEINFLIYRVFLRGGGTIPKHFISKFKKFEVQREGQIFLMKLYRLDLSI